MWVSQREYKTVVVLQSSTIRNIKIRQIRENMLIVSNNLDAETHLLNALVMYLPLCGGLLRPGELWGSAVRTQRSVPAAAAGPVPGLQRLQTPGLARLPGPEDARAPGPGPVPPGDAHGPVLQGQQQGQPAQNSRSLLTIAPQTTVRV